MPLSFRRHLSPLRSFSASLALIALTGCETDRGSRRGPPPPESGAAVKATPEMAAHGTFFAGQLEAEVLLSKGGFGPRGGGGGGPDGGERTRGSFGGGFSGGGMGRRSGGGPRDEGRSSGPSGAERGEPPPRIVTSNQPPVMLHLRLTNHSAESAEIEVLDFNSDLGNFVVQPRKLALGAEQSAEVDPMTSRMGVAAEAIQLVVRIRRNGQTEQQALELTVIPPTAPVAAPGAAGAPVPAGGP